MKRHKSLASLSSDHHHGLSVARMLSSQERINAVGKDEAYKMLADFFNNELLKHFKEEEVCLVPPLKDNLLIKRMCEEHERLRELFYALSSTGVQVEALISFGKLLDSHIRFEERELFHMIESTLPEEALEEIGNLIKLLKRS